MNLLPKNLLALLAFVLVTAGATAVLAMAARWRQIDFHFVSAVLLYLAAAVVVIVQSGRIQGDWKFAAALTAGIVALRAILIGIAGDCPQVGDCRLFSETLRYFLAQGMSDASLRELFRTDYDAHVWISRAFPFFYPLARLFPDNFISMAQLSNVVVGAAHNLLAFWLYRRWLPQRAARFALVLLSLIPLHTWQTLDFTHQFQGAFFVVCTVVALVRLVEAARENRPVWGAAIALGVCLIFLRAQGGMDLFMLLACFATLALAFLQRMGRPALLRLLPAIVVAVAVIYLPAARIFSHVTNARYADVNMNSHPVSFLARGWNLNTWGEFYGTYEQVDRITPQPHKRPLMAGLVVSQMASEPARTLVALPWAKLVKFFIVGFAANNETQFHEAGRPHLESITRATRQICAPLFLALAAIGCWRWPKFAGDCAERWITGLLPLLFVAVYLFFGETSPRYSFHIHFALAMLAGLGLHAIADRISLPGMAAPVVDPRDVIRSLLVAGVLTVFLGLASLAVPLIAKKFARHLFVADMRQAAVSGPTMFERAIPLVAPGAADGIAASSSISITPEQNHRHASLVIWPKLTGTLRDNATVAFIANGKVVREDAAKNLSSVNRIEVPIDSIGSNCELRVEIRSTAGGANWRAGDAAFNWGYIQTY